MRKKTAWTRSRSSCRPTTIQSEEQQIQQFYFEFIYLCFDIIVELSLLQNLYREFISEILRIDRTNKQLIILPRKKVIPKVNVPENQQLIEIILVEVQVSYIPRRLFPSFRSVMHTPLFLYHLHPSSIRFPQRPITLESPLPYRPSLCQSRSAKDSILDCCLFAGAAIFLLVILAEAALSRQTENTDENMYRYSLFEWPFSMLHHFACQSLSLALRVSFYLNCNCFLTERPAFYFIFMNRSLQPSIYKTSLHPILTCFYYYSMRSICFYRQSLASMVSRYYNLQLWPVCKTRKLKVCSHLIWFWYFMTRTLPISKKFRLRSKVEFVPPTIFCPLRMIFPFYYSLWRPQRRLFLKNSFSKIIQIYNTPVKLFILKSSIKCGKFIIKQLLRIQNMNQPTKFGFYCNATNTFYYFENEEEFEQMLRMIEETQLQDLPQEQTPCREQTFTDFDGIVNQMRQNNTVPMEIELQQVDF